MCNVAAFLGIFSKSCLEDGNASWFVSFVTCGKTKLFVGEILYLKIFLIMADRCIKKKQPQNNKQNTLKVNQTTTTTKLFE